MALNAVNETKAYPTIQHPNNNANRGLPTSERPTGLCVMPKGEKSRNGDVREMTLNIRHGNGVPIVVRGRERRLHGEGGQLMRFKMKTD